MDQFYLKNHGCVFPLQTNLPNLTQCTVQPTDKRRIQEKAQVSGCSTPCETMTVYFAGM